MIPLHNIFQMRMQVLYCTRLFCTAKFVKENEYKKCYKILNLPEDSDQDAIRKAYLGMVKRFHPDSSSGEADANKFHEIDRAFRILMDKKSKERWQVADDDAEEEREKHVVPQHRQYLSFDGMGYGSIFQREKQYAQARAIKASENVINHRMQKAIIDDASLIEKVQPKHHIKTKYGFDRLVEDLIQEAMSKGQFNNLSGFGKPLRDVKEQSHYVDFVTHKINEVLIENGFTPEWITLQKEIRDEIQLTRNKLLMERTKFSPFPLNDEEQVVWETVVVQHKQMVDGINKKISKYNLLVPILDRQMFLLDLKKEAHKILTEGKSNKDAKRQYLKIPKTTSEPNKQPSHLLSFLQMLFKG